MHWALFEVLNLAGKFPAFMELTFWGVCVWRLGQMLNKQKYNIVVVHNM